MSLAVTGTITRPAPTHYNGRRACIRCGVIRYVDRRNTEFCVDCKPYMSTYTERKATR